MRATVAVILAAIAVLGAGLGNARAQPAPIIEWRLENTFRLFKRADDTRRMRDAFRALTAQSGRPPTVLEFEQHLATATGGWGWSEALVGHVVQDACWYRRDAECSTYARPTSHRVQVRLPDHAASCVWQVGGTPVAASPTLCSEPVTVEVPYPAGADVSAIVDGAPVATTRIQVKDRLIVSLGDSFASGEGNPDRAVRFHSGRVAQYDQNEPSFTGYPAREGEWRNTSDPAFDVGAAQWLHRACHRSLYSAHARAAMHLAFADEAEHTAVTFLSVACTSAEIENGLFMPAMGKDRSVTSELVTISQLSGVARAICAPGSTTLGAATYALRSIETPAPRTRAHNIFTCSKDKAREIDLLLLSIGGNDIGFSKLVAWTSIGDVAASALARKPEEARRYLAALRDNYGQVDRALRDAIHVTPGRVVLTAYPQMAFSEKSAPCGSGRTGMEVSPVFQFFGDRAASVERFGEGELTPLMRDAASQYGWLWVDSHRAASRAHGFCAQGGGEDTLAAMAFPVRQGKGYASPDTVFTFTEASAVSGSKRRTPTKSRRPGGGARAAGWLEPPPPESDWKPYSPSDFRPFTPRARWVRSPNDAFLTVNLHFGNVGDRVSLTQFVASSGAFHPNAQGHAATADAIRDVIEKAGALK